MSTVFVAWPSERERRAKTRLYQAYYEQEAAGSWAYEHLTIVYSTEL